MANITNRVDPEEIEKRGFSAKMEKAAREGPYLDPVMCRPNVYCVKMCIQYSKGGQEVSVLPAARTEPGDIHAAWCSSWGALESAFPEWGVEAGIPREQDCGRSVSDMDQVYTGVHREVLGTGTGWDKRQWDICDLLAPSLDTVRPISPAILRAFVHPGMSSSSLSPTPIPRPHIPPVVLNLKYFKA